MDTEHSQGPTLAGLGDGTPRPDRGLRDRGELPVRARGRYDLLEEYGSGGLGRVWKARDRELDRIVALKEVLPGDEVARARFVREALVTARLEHPAIVPVHEAGQWDSGEPFYVMKLVSGRTLAAVVAGQRSVAERLALLPSIIAVADAIAYAHTRGVVHRDLKPANVLLGDFGETVVIDWGLAKVLSGDVETETAGGPVRAHGENLDVTEAGTVLGTLAFMAPEQALGKPADERTDIYALGGLLYFALSGRTPFAGRAPKKGLASTEMLSLIAVAAPAPIRALQPGVPRELADIVAKATAADPAARYPTASQLAEDLKRFQTGQLVSAHTYSTGDLVRRWLRRHRALAWATALFVAVSAVGAAAFVWREQRLRRTAERERDRADQKTLALLEEQGRAALASGHPFQAAVYLVEAYRRDPGSLALRALVTQAVRPIARLERAFVGHARDVPYVVYRPDGKAFVTASSDGSARLWDAADGRLLAELRGDDKYLDAAAFSPDGALIATATNAAVRLYDGRGAPLRSFDDRDAYRLWFTPDGKRLILGTQQGELRLRDLATGEILDAQRHHHDRIEDLAFSPDGARFAVASWDSTASLWDLATFRPVKTLDDHQGIVSSVAYSPDGAWLVTVESDDYIHLRRADTGQRVRSIRLPEGARFVTASFRPDGTLLAPSQDGVVRTYHVPSGALLDAFDAEPRGKLMGSALRFDGRQLVTAGVAGSIQVWRLDEHPGWRLLEHPIRADGYGMAEYTRDGAHVFTGEESGQVTRWDAVTGKPLESFRVDGNAFEVVPVGDGARVAERGTAPANVLPALWEVSGGRRLAPLAEGSRRSTDIAVSVDGEALAVTGYDGQVHFYDAATGAPQGALPLGGARLTAVAFRPDGRELAVTDENGLLRLLERTSGRIVRTIQAHPTWIMDVEYSRDGARLVTAGRQDHLAKIWDAATGAPIVTLAGHHDNVMRASFSPDGALVATTGVDHVALIWDARTGELVRTISGPSYTAGFNPSGAAELLATGNYGYAAIWDLTLDPRPPDELAAYVAQRSPWRLVDGRLRLRP